MREANVTSLVRACLAVSRAAARGGTITPADVAHDRDAFALATKAASSPTTLSANLQSLAVDFVAALALGPVSAGAMLLGQGLQLSFSYGGILVPGFVADAANVSFVAEAEPIPVNELTAGAILLEPRKLATNCCFDQRNDFLLQC
jgi:hypothetical protein